MGEDGTLASLSGEIEIVEVGPRDGLQNEPVPVSPESRAELVRRLAAAGLRRIEAGGFVSPKWVPQMAGTRELFALLDDSLRNRCSALVPNLRGLADAVQAGVREIAVFGAASESFSRNNIHAGIEESLTRFAAVIREAHGHGIRVRGYVSCIAGCPYEGDVPVARVVKVARALHRAGCYEISLGDTIGTGTPRRIAEVVRACATEIPVAQLALHLHDTYGQALANVLAGLLAGIRVFDSSVGGLGGCPYAPGASGNLATEDLLYMLEGMGLGTGVDLDAVLAADRFICGILGRPTRSKVAIARTSACAGQRLRSRNGSAG